MILETILSAAGGGLFGLLGAGVKMFMEYKDKVLANKHEVEMAEQSRKDMTMELELSKQQGSIDLELQESDADARNLTAAINAESEAKGASQWVNDLKASTRPILTYLLCIMAIILVIIESQSPWVNEIVFLASTSVTFWFGDRPRSSK
jgi:hypothetical protein